MKVAPAEGRGQGRAGAPARRGQSAEVVRLHARGAAGAAAGEHADHGARGRVDQRRAAAAALRGAVRPHHLPPQARAAPLGPRPAVLGPAAGRIRRTAGQDRRKSAAYHEHRGWGRRLRAEGCWVRGLTGRLAGEARPIISPLKRSIAERRSCPPAGARRARAHPDVRGIRRLERAVGEGHVVGEAAAHAARARGTCPLSRRASRCWDWGSGFRVETVRVLAQPAGSVRTFRLQRTRAWRSRRGGGAPERWRA